VSKRKIVITIDCNAKTCGRCEMFEHGSSPTGYCLIYGYAEAWNQRCPECLKAEAKR
jgi:hypothetical protein